MERIVPPVKGRRQYDSTRRQAQARRAREAVLDTAQRLFLAHGYAATTVGAIAAAADMSVESIYKGFGNKPGLVRAIRDRALAGAGPQHAEERSDALWSTNPDPRAAIAGWGALAAEVAPRVAPILLLVRSAAASDAEVATLQRELDDDRLVRMTHNARYLADRGHLQPGVGLDDAADVLWTYSSPELYELLVISRRWAPDRYGAFIADAMISALLPA